MFPGAGRGRVSRKSVSRKETRRPRPQPSPGNGNVRFRPVGDIRVRTGTRRLAWGSVRSTNGGFVVVCIGQCDDCLHGVAKRHLLMSDFSLRLIGVDSVPGLLTRSSQKELGFAFHASTPLGVWHRLGCQELAGFENAVRRCAERTGRALYVRFSPKLDISSSPTALDSAFNVGFRLLRLARLFPIVGVRDPADFGSAGVAIA